MILVETMNDHLYDGEQRFIIKYGNEYADMKGNIEFSGLMVQCKHKIKKQKHIELKKKISKVIEEEYEESSSSSFDVKEIFK